MKKLMLMIGAVGIAASIQAATVSWSATNIFAGNSTDKASGVAYFLTTSMQETSYWSTLKNASEFQSALSGAYSFMPSAAGTYSKPASAAVDNATLGLSDATAYTAYLLVFDTATITDESKYFITSTKDFTTYGGTSNANIAWLATNKAASQSAAGWATVAVPEPTSGLLMLLGVAGLALRRKRS